MVRPEDVHLNGEEATWEIGLTAPVGGTYMGAFKFRCILNPLQTIQADRDYRKLVGENPALADVRVDNLAFSLAQLRQRVIEAPPFWSDGSEFPGSRVKDLEVVEEVLTAAIEAERAYRKSLADRHMQAVDALKKRIEENKITEEAEEFFDESKPKKKGKKNAKAQGQ